MLGAFMALARKARRRSPRQSSIASATVIYRIGSQPGISTAQWSNLSDRNQVQAGLDLLADLDWIASESILGKGRTKILYHINPRAFA